MDDAPTAPTESLIASLYDDNCGSVTATLIDSDVTGTDCSWTATYTYSIVDDCTNAASNAVVTYTGGDSEAPVWQTAAGNLNRTVDCSDASGLADAQDLEPVATDNCGTVTYVKTPGSFVPGACGGSYTNTWTATDVCDNTTVGVYTQVITVTDNIPPTA